MAQQEPLWLRTLRSEVTRTSARATARKLDYSDRTIRLVLQGKYRSNTDGIAANVAQQLVTRKPKPMRAPQLKQLDGALHRQFKRWAELLTAKTVATVVGIDQARVWPLIRGTDKHGAGDVMELLKRTPFQEVE